METVSGGTVPIDGTTSRDIFKHGASAQLELKMAREDLFQAEYPEPCMECGRTPQVDPEEVKHCKAEVARVKRDRYAELYGGSLGRTKTVTAEELADFPRPMGVEDPTPEPWYIHVMGTVLTRSLWLRGMLKKLQGRMRCD